MVEHFPTDGQGSYIASALAPKLIDFVLSSSFDRREEAVFWWKPEQPLSILSRRKRPFVQAAREQYSGLPLTERTCPLSRSYPAIPLVVQRSVDVADGSLPLSEI